MKSNQWISLLCMLILFVSMPALAAEDDKPAEALTLEGILEARQTAPISVRTEAWQTLTVLKAAAHGATVTKGDLLLTLETEKLNTAIEKARQELTLATFALKEAEAGLEKAKAALALDLAAAERTCRTAQDDLAYYLKKTLPAAQADARHTVAMMEQSLAYEMEELKQLEKMYKADELTEETEEIVLHRQRNRVKNLTYSLNRAREKMDRTLKTDLPRRTIAMKEAAKRAQLTLKLARVSLPLQHKKASVQLTQQKEGLADLQKKLGQLLADARLMHVKAPCSGILYYGECKQGQWSDASQVAGMLAPGGTAKPNTVLMTVVKPQPMILRTQVQEAQLNKVKSGMKGTAQPTAYPDLSIPVVVDDVDRIPLKPGAFGATLLVTIPKTVETLMPGMRCKIKLPVLKEKP